MEQEMKDKIEYYQLIFNFISGCLVSIFLLILLPLFYRLYWKKLKEQQKKKQIGFKTVLQFATDYTLFSYLKILDSENTNFNKVEDNQNSMIISSPHQKLVQEKNEKEFSDTVVCDLYDCCCEGCPWEIEKVILFFGYFFQDNCFMRLYHSLEKTFIKIFFAYQHFIAFVVIRIGSFIYLPLTNLQQLFPNYKSTMPGTLLLLTLEMFVQTFTLSFIITRREMLRLEKQNGIEKGLLLYYHIRKSIIFSFIFLILLATLQFILYQFIGEIQNTFFIFNCYFGILQNIYLILFMKFTNLLSNDLLSDDDRILKAQQRFYALQNNMIKYFPSDQVWLEYVEQLLEQTSNSHSQIKDEEIINNLQIILEIKSQKAKYNLEHVLNAVENQQFKKIKKNLGQKRFYISLLILFIFINPFAQLICNCFLLSWNNKNQIARTISSIQNNHSDFFLLLHFCLNLLSYTLMPFLIGILFNKISFFGVDYTEYIQTGMESWTLIDNGQ